MLGFSVQFNLILLFCTVITKLTSMQKTLMFTLDVHFQLVLIFGYIVTQMAVIMIDLVLSHKTID